MLFDPESIVSTEAGHHDRICFSGIPARCYVSNERGLLGSQWEVQIVFSHLYVSMYMRKIGAFLSFFDYNVRESWNCLELLFYTSFTSNFQLSTLYLFPSRAAHRVACAFEKKTLM